MGTASSAAMTLLNPIQGIMIGALCGLTQAAGVLVGKRLELRRSPGADRRIRPQMAGSLGLFPPLPGGMRPLRHFDARVSPEKVDAAPGGPGRSGRINRPARAANRNLPQPAHPPLALPRAGQYRSIKEKGWAAQNVRPSFSLSKKNFDKRVDGGASSPATTTPSRFCLNPSDSGRKICKEAILQSKISSVVTVHAADHDSSAKGLRPSRALLGGF